MSLLRRVLGMPDPPVPPLYCIVRGADEVFSQTTPEGWKALPLFTTEPNAEEFISGWQLRGDGARPLGLYPDRVLALVAHAEGMYTHYSINPPPTPGPETEVWLAPIGDLIERATAMAQRAAGA